MNPQINNIIKQYIVFAENFNALSNRYLTRRARRWFTSLIATQWWPWVCPISCHTLLFNMFLCMRGESTAPIHHQAWWKVIDDFCVVCMRACAVLKDSLGGNCRTRMLATVGQRVHSSQYHFWCSLAVNFTLYFHPSILFRRPILTGSAEGVM